MSTFDHPLLFLHTAVCPHCAPATTAYATGRGHCVDDSWHVQVACPRCDRQWSDESPAAHARALRALDEGGGRAIAIANVRLLSGARHADVLVIDGARAFPAAAVRWGDLGSYYEGTRDEGFEARLYDGDDELVIVSLDEMSGMDRVARYRLTANEATWFSGGSLSDFDSSRTPTQVLVRHCRDT